MNAITSDNIKRALKEYKPDTVRAILVDGETVLLSKGNRAEAPWKPILAYLDGSAWQRVELLNKRGELLGAPIRNEGAAGDLENMPQLSSRIAETGQLAQIALHAAQSFASMATSLTKPAFDALKEANKDAHELADMYRVKAAEAEARAVRAEERARKAEARTARILEEVSELSERIVEAREESAEKADQAQKVSTIATIGEIAKNLPEIGRALMMGAGMLKNLLGSGTAAPAANAAAAAAKAATS